MMEENKHKHVHQRDDKGDNDDDDDDGTRNYGSEMIPLGGNFQPGKDDVLVGRGKVCRNWSGNIRFRGMVDRRLGDYSAASSKLEKSAIVTSLLYQVRIQSPKGGFIKKDPLTGQWYEVGDFVARERITQSFRDALHGKYRSSNSSKKERRKEELKKAKEAAASSAHEQPAKKAKSEERSMVTSDLSDQASMPPLTTNRACMFPPSELPSSLLQEASVASSISDEEVLGSIPVPLSSSSVSNQVKEALLPMGEFESKEKMPEPTTTNKGGMMSQPPIMMRLDEQIRAVQHRNISNASAQQAAKATYPTGWFQVDSSFGQMPQLALSAQQLSVSGSQTSSASADQFQSSIMPRATTSFSQFSTDNYLTNQVQNYNNNNQLNNMFTCVNGTLLPEQQAFHAYNDSTGCGSFLPQQAHLSFYDNDEDPFEPVPIAEEISRRNSQAKRRM